MFVLFVCLFFVFQKSLSSSTAATSTSSGRFLSRTLCVLCARTPKKLTLRALPIPKSWWLLSSDTNQLVMRCWWHRSTCLRNCKWLTSPLGVCSREGLLTLSPVTCLASVCSFKPEDQLLQCALLCQKLESIRQEMRFLGPVIVAGDANALPDSPPVQFMLEPEYKSSAKAVPFLQKLRNKGVRMEMAEGSCAAGSTISMTNSLDLDSAYRAVLGQEPSISNCKPAFRGQEPFAENLDYIWFSKSLLQPRLVLGEPSRDLLQGQNGGIPSSVFPSDHVSLMASFAFV